MRTPIVVLALLGLLCMSGVSADAASRAEKKAARKEKKANKKAAKAASKEDKKNPPLLEF